ncbi:MAG: hypothetical protein H0X28_04645 [Solirubrobacterales bacterium]|nr:hypothetical protein [Solirubrobacterales bacterium]
MRSGRDWGKITTGHRRVAGLCLLGELALTQRMLRELRRTRAVKLAVTLTSVGVGTEVRKLLVVR